MKSGFLDCPLPRPRPSMIAIDVRPTLNTKPSNRKRQLGLDMFTIQKVTHLSEASPKFSPNYITLLQHLFRHSSSILTRHCTVIYPTPDIQLSDEFVMVDRRYTVREQAIPTFHRSDTRYTIDYSFGHVSFRPRLANTGIMHLSPCCTCRSFLTVDLAIQDHAPSYGTWRFNSFLSLKFRISTSSTVIKLTAQEYDKQASRTHQRTTNSHQTQRVTVPRLSHSEDRRIESENIDYETVPAIEERHRYLFLWSNTPRLENDEQRKKYFFKVFCQRLISDNGWTIRILMTYLKALAFSSSTLGAQFEQERAYNRMHPT
ncbi:hypothetical protein PHYBLDRAFT_153844 [Phycomyces blakesleeanus NRRL 1555(-)]|uniref:Uncharacterized protein n=1 Tax=Phycomyces blakesleeanus (strain ATCC 8743b / DSM 1359 / FGSC 10004 / NBRC 33097 / NRRL 1555) TaxID=763407 RepID=A0A167J3A1_PHYB8|nr:hypothetical protein PHYBLDRAFT_153844 [Phycomyces blakesleeanus NRRL 1555(-)]OAD65047.1 hypothetical protein PHYBLDRAFT_153844 [Phycomyces blakesleeanus NRRL 1555(-)]|eukprot:XP_018283087.1 hypothetical protein PHYBLDRAFT_153844 [Phycomyces blakesleeanus NRRL 1555(-)]